MRQHWAVMANHMLQTGLFLLVVMGVEQALDQYGHLPAGADVIVDNVAFYLALVAVLRFTANTILWWIERIVITDKRVMIAQGIIVHNVGMMPLGKVTDLTFRRTLSGRMLGFGTMVVESAGQIQALNQIDYMPRPEEIYEALSELVFGEKGKTRATGALAKPRWRR
ncbi:PH domain-containing protein [Pseudonocardia sp. 1LY6.1]|uniref:PH domain-containing protein n=1 Tax=Pseudonocardia phyllosphaerae TaxID=3390502 RepID=UPI003978B69C